MARPEPEEKPELGNYKSTVEIREGEDDDGSTHYKVVWRGITAKGSTVPVALTVLAEKIEAQG